MGGGGFLGLGPAPSAPAPPDYRGAAQETAAVILMRHESLLRLIGLIKSRPMAVLSMILLVLTLMETLLIPLHNR
jgi:hypothetical protein